MTGYLGAAGLKALWARCKAVFAAKAHTHDAGDLSSGVLPVERGGTGTSTKPAANSALTYFTMAEVNAGRLPYGAASIDGVFNGIDFSVLGTASDDFGLFGLGLYGNPDFPSLGIMRMANGNAYIGGIATFSAQDGIGDAGVVPVAPDGMGTAFVPHAGYSGGDTPGVVYPGVGLAMSSDRQCNIDLQPATASVLGGVKVGGVAAVAVSNDNRVRIDKDGYAYMSVGGDSWLGVFKVPASGGLTARSNGELSVNVGAGLEIGSDGKVNCTADGADAADRVVARGTCDFWEYRMWASGVAECWGETGATEVSVASAWGSCYYAPAHSNYFPGGSAEHPFSETVGGTAYARLFCAAPPVCHAGWRSSGNDVGGLLVAGGRSATSTETLYVWAPVSTSSSGRYTYHAVGRWKE